MAVFGTWIKRTVQQVLDPDREENTRGNDDLGLIAVPRTP